MQNSYEQLTLGDIYSDIAKCFEEEKPRFFRLMEQHINWDSIIPKSFYNTFYRRMGRKRVYSLESYICMLVLQKLFGYVEDTQLLNTLKHSKEMRDFCGLQKVPDAAKITRFKQQFAVQLEQLFYSLVDLTEPICQSISKEMAIPFNLTHPVLKAMSPKTIRNFRASYSNRPNLTAKTSPMLTLTKWFII